MTRDMDLVREILLAMEAHPHGFAPRSLEIPGFSKEQIGYHAFLMKQAGLVHAVETTAISDESPSALPIYLTWEGFEFLAASKDPSIWKKGTSTVMAKAGAIGFDIIKAVLTAEIRKQVGLP
jgi:hypothetical protein